jgi:rhamnose utilization protein RhaD (predicted bifunctional aldolase and dehydrogenase)/NAD(P)-dependent dehydrogenase (short-subunit alcohol dehydrogenase family)
LKAPRTTLLGDRLDVLFVKGSGAPLDTVGPRDLPGLDLARLRRLRRLESLSDGEMVNQLRTHLLEASSPNPSVETLLHAFLPHRFVDHSHADAVLALTNQPEGEALVREALGERVVVVPYIMPGLPLAKAVAEAVENQPGAQGAVLLKHGLCSFAEGARISYELHIEFVDLCEQFLARKARNRPLLTLRPGPATSGSPEARVAAAAPILRGLLAEETDDEDHPHRRWVMEWRGGPAILDFCSSEEARELVQQGPLTPDHVIWTKALPLYVDDPHWEEPDRLAERLGRAAVEYRRAYDAYFEGCAKAKGVIRAKLDSTPRVVLLPWAGALCFGRSKKEARIAADITEHTLAAKALAEAVGRYESAPASALFDVEVWGPERAKLGSSTERPLERQVVFVTGGAGAIGLGVADVCAAAGAHLVLTDVDGQRAREAATRLEARHGAGSAAGLEVDVTDEASVRAGFDAACVAYGGVDVVVPNAGIALVSPIEELSGDEARRVAEVNYLGVLNTIREAARVFRLQGTGGHVVVNASKNVFAPGKDFGAYSASKAAAHQIGKIAAIELAPLGVRVNQINADAIFDEGEVRSGLWETVGPDRARRRGLDADALPEFYRQRNLLRARVRARHVGNAVVFFASNATPTTGATLPVDGGIPEAFPR